MPLARTTFQPNVVVDMSQSEYDYLLALGLIYFEGDPVPDPVATINVRTTFEPTELVTVSMAEYFDLLTQGLIYSVEGGDPIEKQVAATLERATLVAIGDSHIEQAGQIPSNPQRTADSFLMWGLNLLGQRLELVANLGVGGDSSAGVLQRIRQATGYGAGWIHVLVGTNDAGSGIPAATIIANLRAIYDSVTNSASRLVVGTIPPRTGATTDQRNIAAQVNQWIRDEVTRRPGAVLVDYEAALLDPATGGYPAGAQWSDGVHVKPTGGFVSGRAFANALRPFIPAASPLAAQPGVVNLLGLAGRFFPGDGSTAGGWARSQYAVLPTTSTPARTDDVYGTWRQEVIPNGDKCFYHVNVPVDGVALSVGNTVELLVEYDITALDPAPAANTAYLTVKAQAYVADNFIGANMRYDLWSVPGSANHPVTPRAGTFRTPPLTIPVGATLIQCLIEARGGGTYRFGRATLRKV